MECRPIMNSLGVFDYIHGYSEAAKGSDNTKPHLRICFKQ
jgi:hypothetical protein